MDLEESYFDSMSTHPGTIARLLYYPPQKPRPVGDPARETEEIGLGAHTDYECFTLLLSDSNPGLEVLSPTPDPATGRPKWISAPAPPNSLTVNIADFFQRWTNGEFKSTVHRVVNRSPDKERYSVPFFFSVNYDQKVSTLPRSASETDSPELEAEEIQAGPWILERLRATLKKY
jgi:isopenicillin N synthase-like dioxygenase